jgi:hypothetical protein
LITKGKTKRCLNKFDINKNVIGTYSKSGWAEEECILLVLKQIIAITNDQKSVLIMDQYTSHITDNVKNYASIHNITLIYIPVGMTSIYQPLDVGINGIIKTKLIKMYSNFVANNPNTKYDHKQCLNDLIICKKEINKKNIIKSFDCLKNIQNEKK